MLESLGPRITQLAFASLSSRAAPIQTIQGLLLLCTWPAPVKSMTKDISYMASGAAIHLAMQIGLHIPGVGRDFAPDKVSPDPRKRTFRDRLWLLACVVCQTWVQPLLAAAHSLEFSVNCKLYLTCANISFPHRTSYSEGLPPIVTVDSLNLGLKEDMMVSDLIKFHRELHRIQATAMASLMRQTLLACPMQSALDVSLQASALNILIKSCDAELNDLALEVTGDKSR